MGQYKFPPRARVVPNMQPPPGNLQAAIDQAKKHIETQKEVADMLAEKIVAREQQRKCDAIVASVQIERTRLTESIEMVDALRAQRRANARFAASEIAMMRYEHEGLLMAIGQAEAQIETAEQQSSSMIVKPASTLVG